MAADVLSSQGLRVTVHDRMPSLARKFLMAGRGGLNLTHSEILPIFKTRYGAAQGFLSDILEGFPPEAVMAWSQALGQPVFRGSSGRIFPRALKASPLLRAWLARLQVQGVTFRSRSTWQGWDPDGNLVFQDALGHQETARPAATVLALGGASWGRLGSDGTWAEILLGKGLTLTPFAPSNCGFGVAWTDEIRSRFAGQPLKAIAFSFAGQTLKGEAMITDDGIEGGAIYALSPQLRAALQAGQDTVVTIDLRPDVPLDAICARLSHSRPGQSLSNRLRKALGFSPLETALVREMAGNIPLSVPEALASLIKAVPVRLTGTADMSRAISTAGGLALQELDEGLMIQKCPGVWAVGEMLDWEAPTGGYLLQACLATGAHAGRAILAHLNPAGLPTKSSPA